jgi:hypothetical protein
MALFLANHSTAKIMLLGRWLSDAFLAYIRPQVLEWTNNMSLDMIHLESFLDASSDLAGPTDPRTRTVRNQSFNGHESVVVIPRFYLHNWFNGGTTSGGAFYPSKARVHANTSTN